MWASVRVSIASRPRIRFAKNSLLWQSVGAFMRHLYVMVALICLSLGWGCSKKAAETPPPKEPEKKPEIYFSYHFAGTKQLSANTNTAKLQNVWDLPETKTLRERTLQKLANAPQELLKLRISSPDQDGALLLRPLLDDLLEAESA